MTLLKVWRQVLHLHITEFEAALLSEDDEGVAGGTGGDSTIGSILIGT